MIKLFDNWYLKKIVPKKLEIILRNEGYIKRKRGLTSFYVYVRPFQELDDIFKKIILSISNPKNGCTYGVEINKNRAIIYIEINDETKNINAELGKEDGTVIVNILNKECAVFLYDVKVNNKT